MSTKIPKYSYRGQESKLPSAGDAVGNGLVGKSACYSGPPQGSARQAPATKPAATPSRMKNAPSRKD